MARSRRRTPIISMTTSVSEKQDKRHANRDCRRELRCALRAGADADMLVLPELHDVSNPWAMAKDGKRWVGDGWPGMMRK